MSLFLVVDVSGIAANRRQLGGLLGSLSVSSTFMGPLAVVRMALHPMPFPSQVLVAKKMVLTMCQPSAAISTTLR